jgi:hypothetical protein
MLSEIMKFSCSASQKTCGPDHDAQPMSFMDMGQPACPLVSCTAAYELFEIFKTMFM